MPHPDLDPDIDTDPRRGADGHDDALTRTLRDLMPLCDLLGVRAARGDRAEVVLRGSWDESRCTTGGILHGGYLMALADASGATCAFYNLPEGAVTSTIESKTNMFRPVASGEVATRSTPVHVGRTTIVVQTDITCDDGKLVCRTLQTQAVIPLS